MQKSAGFKSTGGQYRARTRNQHEQRQPQGYHPSVDKPGAGLERTSADDLHVDMVSPEYRTRPTWVAGAAECLKLATEIMTADGLPCGLMLNVRLRDRVKPVGFALRNADNVSRELDDYQPPSLFLLTTQSQNPRRGIPRGGRQEATRRLH